MLIDHDAAQHHEESTTQKNIFVFRQQKKKPQANTGDQRAMSGRETVISVI